MKYEFEGTAYADKDVEYGGCSIMISPLTGMWVDLDTNIKEILNLEYDKEVTIKITAEIINAEHGI